MLFEKIALEEDEVVLKTVRKHWFVIVTELITIALVAILPFILVVAYEIYDQTFASYGLELPINTSVITFTITAWLLFSLIAGFTAWTHYYLDLWLITDRRIISVDQLHFFKRNVAIFRLERLQDIEFQVHGFVATFLDFGTLSAQTAGHHDHNFRSAGMPQPRELQAIIQRAMDQRLKALHILPDETE
jgi:hypothetical protein